MIAKIDHDMLIDSKSWNLSWDTIEDLKGGGQASVKKVQHKDSKRTGFIKILNRQKDLERRARFYREAIAYDSSSHSNIPKLIESNAHHHEDFEYKVYIVTEFINGMTLSKLIKNKGHLSYKTASDIVLSLIDTIEYCHKNGWIHRDIKPDNIILGKDNNPKLLDFGMAFKEKITPDFSTEKGQEVGNRFLRLPELRIDSQVKQDIRSDLSLIGAIYFFLLTGIAPISLKDENGKMPHQREDSLKLIREKFPNSLVQSLAFFDKVFSEKFADRFMSAENMREELLSNINYEENPKNSGIEQDLEIIQNAINAKSSKQLMIKKSLYDKAMSEIKSVHSDLAKKFSPTYKTFQTGHVNFTDGLKNTLGFCHFATQDIRFAPQFLIKVVGDELVIHLNKNAIYRTDLDAPNFSPDFKNLIREIYIKGMRNLIEKNPLG